MNAARLERLAEVRRLIDSGEARDLRIESGISLSEMARPCKVHSSTVWRWETGTRKPRGDDALRYGDVLHLLKSGAAQKAAAS